MAKTKNMIELVKDELSGETMKEIVFLRPKMYSYITDDDHVDKKAKGTKKCVIKPEKKFQDYQECLENNKTKIRSY